MNSTLNPANVAALAHRLPGDRVYWLAERARDLDELLSWLTPTRSGERGDELSALAHRRYQSARGLTVTQPGQRTVSGVALPWLDEPTGVGQREHVRPSPVSVAEPCVVFWRHQRNETPLGHLTGWITDNNGLRVWLDLDPGSRQDAILTGVMFGEIGMSAGFRSRTAGVLSAGGPNEELVRSDPHIVEVSLAAIGDVAYARCTAYRELTPTIHTAQHRQAPEPPARFRHVMADGLQVT